MTRQCPASKYFKLNCLLVNSLLIQQETIIQLQNYTVINLIFQQKSSVSTGHYALLNNMVDCTSWAIIISYMIAIRPTTSYELHSQSIPIYWKCMKTLGSHNSYKNYWLQIAGKYDQLHIVTN